MLYLLDASVLITANNSYYRIDQVPEYWEWLLSMAFEGKLKIPLEQYEEIKEGPKDEEVDLLYAWIQSDNNRERLILSENADSNLVRKVVEEGYAVDLTDDEVEQLGRDPFLIAYALDQTARCVVTTETSRPKAQRQNRKIPDVCKQLGIQCIDPFAMNRALGFRTSWKISS